MRCSKAQRTATGLSKAPHTDFPFEVACGLGLQADPCLCHCCAFLAHDERPIAEG